ncbi:hypothetical protein FACS1894187_25800 [Synergistales bacterium]|nr:hypothetical protein FACS1894187_25800 [Synergistales bacterium]
MSYKPFLSKVSDFFKTTLFCRCVCVLCLLFVVLSLSLWVKNTESASDLAKRKATIEQLEKDKEQLEKDKKRLETTPLAYGVTIREKEAAIERAKTYGVSGNIVYYGGHSYRLIEELTDWPIAMIRCELMGGHLWTITSEQEYQSVINQLKIHPQGRYWIGGTDAKREGQWEWITGEPLKFARWLGGRPDNADRENFLEIYSGHVWNDAKPHHEFHYICEWDFEVKIR